jgi:hypothetical protein
LIDKRDNLNTSKVILDSHHGHNHEKAIEVIKLKNAGVVLIENLCSLKKEEKEMIKDPMDFVDKIL